MEPHHFSCRQARQLCIVEYLQTLGHNPQKIIHNDYWYYSPFRPEKEPSFKVNRKLNVWYDYGMGKGGNIIDFGILYHQCSVKELLEKLQSVFSFHPQISPAEESLNRDDHKVIKVTGINIITSPALCSYLDQRRIPMELANQYCKEVRYELYGKSFYAIGFPNKAGGYELRNRYFKGSSSPKDVALSDQHCNEIAVFEGFFSFLSFQAIHQDKGQPLTNFLVLNSLSFFEKSRSLMERHDQVNLYLDRDEAGIKATKKAMAWNGKYIDNSHHYKSYKDLNECLVRQHTEPKQSHKVRRQL